MVLEVERWRRKRWRGGVRETGILVGEGHWNIDLDT
jgi:hypothetical protein